MPDITDLVEFLDQEGSLELGLSPWAQDDVVDGYDFHRIDWRRLFPSQQIEVGPWGDYEWGPDQDDGWYLEIPEEIVDSIWQGNESGGGGLDSEQNDWDVCAWYQPIHFHGYGFGIFIREQCLFRLARKLYARLRRTQTLPSPAPSLALLKALLRAAFVLYYQHKLYHHKTERLGPSSEIPA